MTYLFFYPNRVSVLGIRVSLEGSLGKESREASVLDIRIVG